MGSRLDWFMQHFPSSENERDVVRVHVIHTTRIGKRDVKTSDEVQLSNDALVTLAKKRGKVTWDEADVADLASEALGVTVEIVQLEDPSSE